MKSLKALKNIKEELEEAHGCEEFNINVWDDYVVVKQALERLEKIDSILKQNEDNYFHTGNRSKVMDYDVFKSLIDTIKR